MTDEPQDIAPLVELVRLAERYIDATEADCSELAEGHETTCQCAPHREVRSLGVELRQLIGVIRGS